MSVCIGLRVQLQNLALCTHFYITAKNMCVFLINLTMKIHPEWLEEKWKTRFCHLTTWVAVKAEGLVGEGERKNKKGYSTGYETAVLQLIASITYKFHRLHSRCMLPWEVNLTRQTWKAEIESNSVSSDFIGTKWNIATKCPKKDFPLIPMMENWVEKLQRNRQQELNGGCSASFYNSVNFLQTFHQMLTTILEECELLHHSACSLLKI